MYELFSGKCRWRWLTATTNGLFFSKLPYLQMLALQSWSGCQPAFLRAGHKYSCKYPYNPIDLTWAATFKRNFAKSDKRLLCQISAQWHLQHYVAIYLKIWRLSLQNISRCGLALKTRFLWRRARSWPVCIFEMLDTVLSFWRTPSWDRLFNPRPAGPLDFPPPAGGGAFERPPMISAPGRRREKRKAAFESSRKIISKSFRSFFGSGQNWGLQGSKFQNFPKRFFDDTIFIFKGRATILIPSCLSR